MPKVQIVAEPNSGRGNRGRRVTTSLAEINVVPLVDVMLVLLIIFMVTAPLIQRGVDVNLPVTTRSSQIVGTRVFVTVPATYQQTRMVYLDDELIRIDALQERIRQKMETATDKEVFLRADGSVVTQDLMTVFDRLKGAGVEKVGIVTKLPGER